MRIPRHPQYGDYVVTLDKDGRVICYAEESQDEDDHQQLGNYPPAGVETVYELSKHTSQEQKIQVRYTHVDNTTGISGKTTSNSYTLMHQYLFSYQIRDLLGVAGLEIKSIQGNFDEAEFDDDSPMMVITARLKPAQCGIP